MLSWERLRFTGLREGFVSRRRESMAAVILSLQRDRMVGRKSGGGMSDSAGSIAL